MRPIYSPFGGFWNYLGEPNYSLVRILQNPPSFRLEDSRALDPLEVDMNDPPTFASGTPVWLVQVLRWNASLAALRRIVATWRWRIRYRRELVRKLQCGPHLIDDIGLTRQQVEAEIAKSFWQR